MTTAIVKKAARPRTRGKIDVPVTTPPEAKGWNETTVDRLPLYRKPSPLRRALRWAVRGSLVLLLAAGVVSVVYGTMIVKVWFF